ncbi:MAG TPA: peptidyl-alpha-hydroxyglycine alpha-amidating lyase family protein [Steroidobacteraceae bacterium]|nr:peptidyl-alpha-hydroxyglycine alpha-amidating lyase family protein [Steroidobacteraceae bacterium]
MKRAILIAAALWFTAPVLAQRPSDPALLVPQSAPGFGYVAAPAAVTLPTDIKMGPAASVAVDAKGHLIVLTRGDKAFFEFDRDGHFVRAFGDKLFIRAHGLRIDREGNLWATDYGGHVVVKLDRDGRTLLTIGTRGEAGEWNEATGSHRLNQPNDVAIARNGDVFVAEGHTPGPNGDPRVLKFDKDGKFLKSWGGKGSGPGQFQVAHGIAIDAKGLLWVADRENQRIQIFRQDGSFVREIHYQGLPCGLDIGRKYIYMVNGFAGQLLKLDLKGKVLGAMGRPGREPGEFGEAHMVAVNDRDEIFIADAGNGAVFKFIKK